jgi:hypothetical protein
MRTSRRGHAAVREEDPVVPMSEIRTRRWTKQITVIGHISIPKWIPGIVHSKTIIRSVDLKIFLAVVWC